MPPATTPQVPPSIDKNQHHWRGFFKRRVIIRTIAELLLLGLVILLALTAKDYADQQGWSNGDLAAEFFTSPGFAGCLAVVAAAIGFTAVHRQLQHNRLELAHEQQVEANKTWWATFQWVADRALAAQNEGETMPPTIAAAMLLDLSKDELGATSGSVELPALWESRQRACNGLAIALGSKIDPSTPSGQEVLDSLTKLAGATGDYSVESPELKRQLEILSTRKGMFQKLSVVGREHGMEVITDPTEMELRLGLSRRVLRPDPDALVVKQDKYVWVHLISSSTSSNSRDHLKRSLERLPSQADFLAGHPYLFVLHEPVLETALARIDVPEYVHISTDVGTESSTIKDMKEKLVELFR